MDTLSFQFQFSMALSGDPYLLWFSAQTPKQKQPTKQLYILLKINIGEKTHRFEYVFGKTQM